MDEYDDEGLTCHTAPGVVFTTMDDLKEHYRSDWHRYNLKRKVAGLPVVGKELFERVMQQAAAGKNGAQKATGTSHLKRPDELPRSAQRAQRFVQWAENHKEEIQEAEEYARRLAAGEISDGEDHEDGTGEDGAEHDEEGESDDDGGAGSPWRRTRRRRCSRAWRRWRWKTRTTTRCAPTPRKPNSDDATPDVFRRPERRRHPRASHRSTRDEPTKPRRPPSQDYGSESDDDEEMQLDLSNAPVRLADNGYELIITRDDGTKKRIGPRELRGYYRQRHRPEDNRQSVLAIKAENAERGLNATRVGTGNDKLAKYDQNGRLPRHFLRPRPRPRPRPRWSEGGLRTQRRGSRMIMGGGLELLDVVLDLNGQNVKTKLPKALDPYSESRL